MYSFIRKIVINIGTRVTSLFVLLVSLILFPVILFAEFLGEENPEDYFEGIASYYLFFFKGIIKGELSRP